MSPRRMSSCVSRSAFTLAVVPLNVHSQIASRPISVLQILVRLNSPPLSLEKTTLLIAISSNLRGKFVGRSHSRFEKARCPALGWQIRAGNGRIGGCYQICLGV